MLALNGNNHNTNEIQSPFANNYNHKKTIISEQFGSLTFKTLPKSKIDGKWSQPCCDKIQRINDYEIKYCYPTHAALHHKMSFGDKMVTPNNNGVFEIEILIVNIGDVNKGDNFSFGVTVAEGNKYFKCGESSTWGVTNHNGYGCNFHIEPSGKAVICDYNRRPHPKGTPLANGGTAICRLDLINNKLLFKFNNGKFLDSKFDGFSADKRAAGYYFVYPAYVNNCQIRVLRCEKLGY